MTMNLRLFPRTAALLITWAGLMTSSLRAAEPDWITYDPKPGPGNGKHVVFLSGDEEYRSEEGGSLTHPEALDAADAIVLLLRFRHWDDAAMKRFAVAVNRGVPIIALRTSTHAFNGFPKDSPWQSWKG